MTSDAFSLKIEDELTVFLQDEYLKMDDLERQKETWKFIMRLSTNSDQYDEMSINLLDNLDADLESVIRRYEEFMLKNGQLTDTIENSFDDDDDSLFEKTEEYEIIERFVVIFKLMNHNARLTSDLAAERKELEIRYESNNEKKEQLQKELRSQCKRSNRQMLSLKKKLELQKNILQNRMKEDLPPNYRKIVHKQLHDCYRSIFEVNTKLENQKKNGTHHSSYELVELQVTSTTEVDEVFTKDLGSLLSDTYKLILEIGTKGIELVNRGFLVVLECVLSDVMMGVEGINKFVELIGAIGEEESIQIATYAGNEKIDGIKMNELEKDVTKQKKLKKKLNKITKKLENSSTTS